MDYAPAMGAESMLFFIQIIAIVAGVLVYRAVNQRTRKDKIALTAGLAAWAVVGTLLVVLGLKSPQRHQFREALDTYQENEDWL